MPKNPEFLLHLKFGEPAYVTVTPKMAQAWLGTKAANRNPSESMILSFAEEMEAKRWRRTNQGIGFDTEGALIDGEHRLRACVLADVPFETLIVIGMSSTVRGVIDMGKRRSLADLYTMGGSKSGTAMVGYLNMLHYIKTGKRAVLSKARADEIFEEFKEEIEWGLGLKVVKGITSAPVIGGIIFAYQTAPTEVGLFGQSLITGLELKADSPVFLLRSYLLGRPGGRGAKDTQWDICLKTMRAVEAYLGKEALQRLQPTDSGLRLFGVVHGLEVIHDKIVAVPPAVRKKGA